MNNDVILNKVSVIERCLKRVVDVYEGNPENLEVIKPSIWKF